MMALAWLAPLFAWLAVAPAPPPQIPGWRTTVAWGLAFATALLVDRLTMGGRYPPPGFAQPPRRVLAGFVLALFFLLAVFQPAMTFGLDLDIDLESMHPLWLFALNILALLTLALWYALGYAGTPGAEVGWLGQFGLMTRQPSRELGLGVAVGLGAWAVALLASALGAVLLDKLGGGALAEAEAPAEIVWMAALPWGLRLAVSVGAGVFEETFFRGFLQPRIGVAASTALFVLAHLGYGELRMLFGITVLSLIYGLLAKARRNIWAAIVAHTLFDAVQLLVVIPAALEALEAAPGAAEPTTAAVSLTTSVLASFVAPGG